MNTLNHYNDPFIVPQIASCIKLSKRGAMLIFPFVILSKMEGQEEVPIDRGFV